MKKKVFFLLTFIFLMQIVISVSAQLEINPNNRHYLMYNGEPIFLITDGNDLGVGGTSYPFNHKIITILPATGRPNMLYKNEDINAGWNQANWDNLRNEVSSANDQDIIIGIHPWSTPMLEDSSNPKRWASHLWNEVNGGPIADDGNGKDEFYTFDTYDVNNELPDSYNPLTTSSSGICDTRGGRYPNTDWCRDNRYYQEQLVKKYLTELADFDNVYYVPMYELGDFGGSSESKALQWLQYIRRLIKKYQPNRLIGDTDPGTAEDKALVEAEDSETGERLLDLFLFEGPGAVSSSKAWDDFSQYNIPLVWAFVMDCDPGDCNVPPDQVASDMREAVVNGLQPASQIRGGCSGNPDPCDFAQRVSDFIDTVETWCDEPGQEITSSSVPPISGGSGVDLPPGSCQDSDGPRTCSPSCKSWSNPEQNCGTQICKRLDCSEYTNTKECVTNPGDINNDNEVNLLDILIVVKHFGKTSDFDERADANGDKVINLLDILEVIKNWDNEY